MVVPEARDPAAREAGPRQRDTTSAAGWVVPEARRTAPRGVRPAACGMVLTPCPILIPPCLRCPVPPERREAAAQRPVNEVIPDLNGHTTHDLGIDDDIQLNAAAVNGGQRRCQPFALAVT